MRKKEQLSGCRLGEVLKNASSEFRIHAAHRGINDDRGLLSRHFCDGQRECQAERELLSAGKRCHMNRLCVGDCEHRLRVLIKRYPMITVLRRIISRKCLVQALFPPEPTNDHSLNVPKPARVFLGSKMDEANKAGLRAICQEREIEVWQKRLAADKFMLHSERE